MAYINLLITKITGYTPTQRGEAISQELLKINIPIAEQCGSVRCFDVITHPTTSECVLKADTDYKIWVHPKNNLSNLIALMPDLPQAVKNGLVDLVQKNQTITFGQFLKDKNGNPVMNVVILTDEQMQAAGWFDEQVTP